MPLYCNSHVEKLLYVNKSKMIIIVPFFISLFIHRSNKTSSLFKIFPYYNSAGHAEVPFTLPVLITVFSGFCLHRSSVSPSPLQSLHGESADVCGQQRGRVRPAGAEDAGTVPAGYLCWQHLWAQWVYLYIYQCVCVGPDSMKDLLNRNHEATKGLWIVSFMFDSG